MIKAIFTITFLVALMLAPAVGYVSNIYKLVSSDFEAPYKSEIIRGIGIPVAIVGMIVGYMDIGDEK